MEARELRIGNLVYIVHYANKHMAILQVSADGMQQVETGYGAECGYVGERDLTPIPITEEWLLKFGFVLTKHELSNDFFYCIKNEGKNISILLYENKLYLSSLTPLKHIHQLQNLYFALTGTELTLKK